MEAGTYTSDNITFRESAITNIPFDFQAVYDYWNTLRGDEIASTWQDFDMMRIPSKILPSTMVKDVEYAPLAFRFRFYGSRFVHMGNREYTGRTVADMEGHEFAQATTASLITFIDQKVPKFYSVEKQINLSEVTIQTQLRLPLSNNGKTVSQVVSLVDHHINAFEYSNLELDGKVPQYFGHS